MARPIATLLKEAAQIKNSDMLSEAQKQHALFHLKNEIDAAVGQSELPGIPPHNPLLPAKTGGDPPAPQQPVLKGQRPA